MHRYITSLGAAAQSARTYTCKKSVRSESASPLCPPATFCFVHAIGDELMPSRAFVAIVVGVPAPSRPPAYRLGDGSTWLSRVPVPGRSMDMLRISSAWLLRLKLGELMSCMCVYWWCIMGEPGADAGERGLLPLNTLATVSRIPLPLPPPPPDGEDFWDAAEKPLGLTEDWPYRKARSRARRRLDMRRRTRKRVRQRRAMPMSTPKRTARMVETLEEDEEADEAADDGSLRNLH